MGYIPIIYSNFKVELPELNWRVSVSVDTFNFNDTTPYKIFWQSEPREITDVALKLIKNHKFYDLILAWDAEVLSECSNARLFPTGSVWTQESDTSKKKFAVSYLTSSKVMCLGHQFRQDIFKCMPVTLAEALEIRGGGLEQEALAEFPYLRFLSLTKYKSPPYLPTKRDLLVPFQYSIVMENSQQRNWFTEKVNDAFATKTIPIYWGAPNIGEFYNTDGVLSWDSAQDLFAILNQLTPEYYQSKQAAIEENYERSLKYADRTGNVVKAIINSWNPKIEKIHGGEPNVP